MNGKTIDSKKYEYQMLAILVALCLVAVGCFTVYFLLISRMGKMRKDYHQAPRERSLTTNAPPARTLHQ